jgi:hypothetical protein
MGPAVNVKRTNSHCGQRERERERKELIFRERERVVLSCFVSYNKVCNLFLCLHLLEGEKGTTISATKHKALCYLSLVSDLTLESLNFGYLDLFGLIKELSFL